MDFSLLHSFFFGEEAGSERAPSNTFFGFFFELFQVFTPVAVGREDKYEKRGGGDVLSKYSCRGSLALMSLASASESERATLFHGP